MAHRAGTTKQHGGSASGRPRHRRSRRRTAPDATGASSDGDVALRHMFGRDIAYVLGGVLPLAFSALILPALTRLMGRQQFGIVAFAIAITYVLYIILTFGMQWGVQREYPREGGRDRARELITVSTGGVVVATAALALSAPAWSGFIGAGHFSWAMVLTSIYSGGAATTLVCLGFLRSEDRLAAFLTIALLQSVVGQLAGVTLILVLAPTAHHYLLGIVGGQVAAAALALALVRPRVTRFSDLGQFARMLTFTLPLVPNQLGSFLLWSGDRIVVQRDLGSIAQARYAVAYAVGAIAINVTSQLNQAWMPRVFAIKEVVERRRVLVKVQRQLTGLLSPAVFAISMATPYLLLIASPASYRPYGLVLVTVLIVPTALVYSVALANTRTLLAHGKTGRLAISTFSCAILNIVLNVMWVPHLGITGSALATLVSYACQAWLSSVMVRTEADRLPNRLRTELMEWAVIGACVATAAIPHDALGTTGRAIAVVLAVIIAAMRYRGRSSVTTPEPVAVMQVVKD